MPRNELGYGDVDARPDAADPTPPAAMTGSGHSVGGSTPADADRDADDADPADGAAAAVDPRA